MSSMEELEILEKMLSLRGLELILGDPQEKVDSSSLVEVVSWMFSRLNLSNSLEIESICSTWSCLRVGLVFLGRVFVTVKTSFMTRSQLENESGKTKDC